MLSIEHSELKSQVTAACLDVFPEAQAVVIWGGAATADFDPARSDIDVIIEIDASISQESALSERLKKLVLKTKFCRLDPFLYLTENPSVDPLEFIAPFGFYKANAFIPYMIQNQNEVSFGESRLLPRLPMKTLSSTLFAHLPQVMLSLRRLRMDAQVETSASEIVSKHKPGILVALRTLYAFDQSKIGSKADALAHLIRKFPDYQPLADLLKLSPEGLLQASDALTPEGILAFSKDMVEALEAAKRRETVH